MKTTAPLFATLLLIPACLVGATDPDPATHRAALGDEWLEIDAEPQPAGLGGYAFLVSHGDADFTVSLNIDSVPETLDDRQAIAEVAANISPALLDHALAGLDQRIADAPAGSRPALEAMASLLPLIELSLQERADVVYQRNTSFDSEGCFFGCFNSGYSTDQCTSYCDCRAEGGGFWSCASKHLWKRIVTLNP